jgi:hypothetical protein
MIFFGMVICLAQKLFERSAPHALPIFHGQPKLAQYFFVWDAFSKNERSTSSGGTAFFFLADGLVLIRNAGKALRIWIDDIPQETDSDRKLARSHAVDQLVRLLSRIDGHSLHKSPFFPSLLSIEMQVKKKIRTQFLGLMNHSDWADEVRNRPLSLGFFP